FPLTIAGLGVIIGVFVAGIGVLTAAFVLYVVMYFLAALFPVAGVWGIFSFVFDFPDTFAVGMTGTAMCFASIGLGCFMIVLSIITQKQINKLFRKRKKVVLNENN
ncbi:MAG: hypothetical protein LBQ05_03045, partial [Christensenellaceae bacterium]|nr:hypothetical protein [Christensenellaceae bacterium]